MVVESCHGFNAQAHTHRFPLPPFSPCWFESLFPRFIVTRIGLRRKEGEEGGPSFLRVYSGVQKNLHILKILQKGFLKPFQDFFEHF